jgi:NADH kinase
VLSFSMGTLGFLLPFRERAYFFLIHIDRWIRRFNPDVDDFSKALESVFQGKATVLYRMRLSCAFSDKDGNSIGNEGEGIRVCAFYSTQ